LAVHVATAVPVQYFPAATTHWPRDDAPSLLVDPVGQAVCRDPAPLIGPPGQ